jgi:hypothetical protein
MGPLLAPQPVGHFPQGTGHSPEAPPRLLHLAARPSDEQTGGAGLLVNVQTTTASVDHGAVPFLPATKSGHRHEALSSEGFCKFNKVILGVYTFPQPLGGGARFAGRFGYEPCRSATSLEEDGGEFSLGLKKRPEPPIGYCLEIPDEFEQTQFALRRVPQQGPQPRAERVIERDEEQPSIEIT